MNLKYNCFDRRLILFTASIFIFFTFISLACASDFDFYGSDLIAKESYRKISMDFRDANLKNILKIFSEQSGLNFIASQSVNNRTVTLYLDNVPLQEALNKIMSANNLKYELDAGSNVFVVKESGKSEIDTITKVYNLKYARISTSKLSSAIGGGGGIEGLISSMLSSNGKMISDPRTNSLIITDIPTQFEVIDKIVASLDIPTPQVMIEVEMLDVSKRTVDELGIDTSQKLMSLTGSSQTTRFPNFLADGASGLTGSSFTYGTLSSAVFTAVLDFLTTDSKTKFLARPRILTLSNETAEIKISTQEAIGQNSITTSAEGSATSTSSAERYETGVNLKVTPQVDVETGMVTMFIQPIVAQAKTGATFGNTTYKDPEVRSSSTTLMVKNGETIVVGGLIKMNEEITIKKMPFLGDIPFIGAGFRHKSKTMEERELIVFITPRILGQEPEIDLASLEKPASSARPHREQVSAFSRKTSVDNMLQKWEN